MRPLGPAAKAAEIDEGLEAVGIGPRGKEPEAKGEGPEAKGEGAEAKGEGPEANQLQHCTANLHIAATATSLPPPHSCHRHITAAA